MATLRNLVEFAQAYKISQSEMRFQGEYDVVYLDVPAGLVPAPEDISDEERDTISERYGIYDIEGYWGFYT